MKIFSFFAFFLPFLFLSQKKTIDHHAYNDWKSISNTSISKNGKYSIYTIKPLRGDGYLFIVNNETGKKDSIFRAINPLISGNDNFVAYKITPGFDTLRNCELNKVKKDKWPKDSLGIYLFEKDTIIKFPKIKSFILAENSDWIAFLKDDNKNENQSLKKKKHKKKHKVKEVISDGTILSFFNPLNDDFITHSNVSEVYFSKHNDIGINLIHTKEKTDSISVQITDLVKKETWVVPQKFTQVNKVVFNEKGTDLAFYASYDTVQKNKNFAIFHLSIQDKRLTKIIDTNDIILPKNKWINEKSALYFSENTTRLFFGLTNKIKTEKKDTLLESEKAILDVWNWKDNRLQPQQLKEIKKDEIKSDIYFYNLKEKKVHFIANDSLSVNFSKKANENYVLAEDINPYLYSYQWDSPWKSDLYRINVNTSEKLLLKKQAVHLYKLSPSGNYFAYYNEQDKQLYLNDLTLNTSKCVTCLASDEWLEDGNGVAEIPNLITGINWIKSPTSENELSFLLHSKCNFYEYNISQNSLRIISNEGSKQKTWQYNSIGYWNMDSVYFYSENSYVKAQNIHDKSETLLTFEIKNNQLFLVEKMKFNESILGLKKAKNANSIIFQKQSVLNYPDLFLTKLDNNLQIKQISNANPQQKEYNWATVELIKWKNYEGIELEGLVYKPENFDSTKKYPLLVYYYELHGDDLHSHYAPRPTASIIHPTEYASSGYIVFIPDVRYKLAYPARGAYSCIMSGTDYVLRIIPQIDSTKMGLQGQSWGGYQTAQLITMTKRFKAAMAGAPVSNMFSAYGGIRWGSGLNRQFQYEKQQSRIGKTIWESPELYFENSPLFHLPNVETPLLIMHNDMDGAVPWYQGIELFTGLKRLQKPVWMLNYNGDDHNLTKLPNKIDLSIRMKQFFDYYLKDKELPIWMSDGIPAIDKGKKYNLELK
jgi:hypothetical protein